MRGLPPREPIHSLLSSSRQHSLLQTDGLFPKKTKWVIPFVCAVMLNQNMISEGSTRATGRAPIPTSYPPNHPTGSLCRVYIESAADVTLRRIPGSSPWKDRGVGEGHATPATCGATPCLRYAPHLQKELFVSSWKPVYHFTRD